MIEHPHMDMTWEEFKHINLSINKTIMDEAFNERDGISLPGQMGRIYLGLFKTDKFKGEKLPVDQYIRLNPLYIGEFDGKIVWDFRNVNYKVENRNFYAFIGHRNFKERAHKTFRETPEPYFRLFSLKGTDVEYEKRLKLEEYEQRYELDSASGDQPDQDAK